MGVVVELNDGKETSEDVVESAVSVEKVIELSSVGRGTVENDGAKSGS